MSQRGSLRLVARTWFLDLRVVEEPGQPRKRRSFRVGTKRDLPSRVQARYAADRLVNRFAPAKLNPSTVMPVADWCDRFVDAHVAFLSDHTRSTQAAIVLRHIKPYFPDRDVHEIDAPRVQLWINRMFDTGASAATIHARFSVLRRMLRAAEAEGLAVTTISARQVRLPVLQTPAVDLREKAFSPEEAGRILAAAPLADATAYGLCLYLGLRSGEALGLSWACVDLQTGNVHVRQQAQDGQLRKLKTRSSEAWLRAPGPLLDLLQRYRATWSPNPLARHDLLFADAQGRPWRSDALRDRLHALLEQIGIRRRGLHALRHCAAYSMASTGCSPEVLRRALRHASMQTTMKYLSATSSDIAQGFEAAAGLLERARQSPAWRANDASPTHEPASIHGQDQP